MEERKKHIDDLFREALGSYQEKPEASVWHSLAQRLPATPEDNKSSYKWLWLLLLLALMASLGYYVHLKINDSTTGMNNKTANTIATNSTGNNDKILSKNSKEQENISADTASSISSINSKKNAKSELIADKNPSSEKINRNKEKNSNKNDQKNINNQKKFNADKTKSKNEKALDNRLNKNDQHNKKANNNSKVQNEINENANSEKEIVSGKLPNKKRVNQDKSDNSKEKKTGNSDKAFSTSNKKNTKTNSVDLINTNNVSNQKKTSEKLSSKQNSQKDRVAKKNVDGETIVALQNAREKSRTNQSKNINDSNQASQNIIPNNNTVNNPVVVSPEKASPKPINVKGESFKKDDQPSPQSKENDKELTKDAVTVFDKKSNEFNSAAANDKKPNESLAPEDEYGIRIDKYLSEETNLESGQDNEEENSDVNNNGSGTGGGGGSTATTKKNKNGLKINGGIKLAFDKGFSELTTNNYIISPFLQWNISPKISLLVQPGFRYNQINKTQFFAEQSFHDITSQLFDSLHVIVNDSLNSTIQRNYFYSNTYDSINASYSLKPDYWEIELPFLLQYRIAENISFFGGFQLAFGKIVQIEGSLQKISGLQRYDSLGFPTAPLGTSSYPNPPSINNYFSYNTPEYSEVNPDDYKNTTSNPARFGLMFGLSYELRKRLLIDLVVRKNISNMQYIPNEQVRKIYTQPYMRISIGYKLFR